MVRLDLDGSVEFKIIVDRQIVFGILVWVWFLLDIHWFWMGAVVVVMVLGDPGSCVCRDDCEQVSKT